MVRVVVDHVKCTGDGICKDVCPVDVFECMSLPECGGEVRSVVINDDACIICMACVVNCPNLAISVAERDL